MTSFNDLISELDSLFSRPKTLPKAGPERSAPQKPEPKPEPRFWIPVAVVLTRHSWQCSCGCGEEGTPSLFVREQMGRATRLRRCGRDNYPQLPHVLEHLEPEQVDTCPYCFEETQGNERQLRFMFSEELDPFIKALEKTFSEEHAERIEAVSRMGLSLSPNQPEIYPEPSEPFAFAFQINDRSSIYTRTDALQHLDDETTRQAADLARRGLIDLL